MMIVDSKEKSFFIPYPKYNGFTGLPKQYRWQVCVDATGELADISCGEAWLDKYMDDENTWSFVICMGDLDVLKKRTCTVKIQFWATWVLTVFLFSLMQIILLL